MKFNLIHNSFLILGVEGLIYHKHLKSNVFSIRFVPSRLQTFGIYSFGYGVPIIIVAITLIISAADGPDGILHYVQKFYDENGKFDQMVCWIDQDLVVWCFIIPVSLIIFFNLGVVIMIVNVAYHSASHQRLISSYLSMSPCIYTFPIYLMLL